MLNIYEMIYAELLFLYVFIIYMYKSKYRIYLDLGSFEQPR